MFQLLQCSTYKATHVSQIHLPFYSSTVTMLLPGSPVIYLSVPIFTFYFPFVTISSIASFQDSLPNELIINNPLFKSKLQEMILWFM